MEAEIVSREHHVRRSEFIRRIVQGNDVYEIGGQFRSRPQRTIVQYWHDHRQIPGDIQECIASWTKWREFGYTHRIFDEHSARSFIHGSMGRRHGRAFERCYHPAMQADYFRLCFLFVEGGLYVDADDVFVGTEIDSLFEDGRLKLQPLCYDRASQTMVKPSLFLCSNAYDPNWTFYFNNNPLGAGPGHPIVGRALDQATCLLEFAGEGGFPEIQETTGPGNLTKAIFDLGTGFELHPERDLVVLRDWESRAFSQWPLSHREDSRNWRLCNQKAFVPVT